MKRIELMSFLRSRTNQTQPPFLAIAPFLSLSQIRDLAIHLPFQGLEVPEEPLDDLYLDRAPTHTPLPLQQLEITSENSHLSLLPFSHLFNPNHLIVQGGSLSSKNLTMIQTGEPEWNRLETVVLKSVASETALHVCARAGWPSLARVTYQYEREDVYLLDDLVGNMTLDLPMPEGVKVVVVVEDADAKSMVLIRLKERSEAFEGGAVLLT